MKNTSTGSIAAENSALLSFIVELLLQPNINESGNRKVDLICYLLEEKPL